MTTCGSKECKYMDVFTLGQHSAYGSILILSSHLRLITQLYFRMKCWVCINSNFSYVTQCLWQSQSHAMPVTVTKSHNACESQSHSVPVTVTKSRSACDSHKVTQCLWVTKSLSACDSHKVTQCLWQSQSHAVPVTVTKSRSAYHSHVTPRLSLTTKCLHLPATWTLTALHYTILVLLFGIRTVLVWRVVTSNW